MARRCWERQRDRAWRQRSRKTATYEPSAIIVSAGFGLKKLFRRFEIPLRQLGLRGFLELTELVMPAKVLRWIRALSATVSIGKLARVA